MARVLVLRHQGTELPFALEKLDRGKLYGSTSVEALDDQGRRCELATLASDGKTLLGKGGTATAFLSPEGSWLERADLTPVDAFNEPLAPLPSSFNGPINLDLGTEATIDDYLTHNIKSVYTLSAEAADDPDLAALLAELRAGKLYRFPFSWRGGLTADVGFLLANPAGEPFLAVGQPTRIHFLGLDVLPVYEDEETDEAAAADDELDFGMM
jgi:hypothetical protein